MAPPPVVQFQPMIHQQVMQQIDNQQPIQHQLIEQSNQFQLQQSPMQNIQTSVQQHMPFLQQVKIGISITGMIS